jgi:hypothetical protein
MSRYGSSSSSSGGGGITLIAYLFIAIYMFFPGCSENACARHWDEDMTFELPCEQKLVNATWDGSDLVYTTRPMVPGETATDTKLSVKVNWFLMFDAGVVTIKECGDGGPPVIAIVEMGGSEIVPR